MKNFEHIKYTYKHRKIVVKLAEKYFKSNPEVLEQVATHDLDKMYLYLFFDKKDVSHIHRESSAHHENDLEKTYIDYVEMVLDWESARYTKPDKPLNAYETLIKFYPSMLGEILPILREMGINKANLPMDEEILKLAQELDKVSEEDIIKELKDNIDLITSKDKTKSFVKKKD